MIANISFILSFPSFDFWIRAIKVATYILCHMNFKIISNVDLI